MSKKRQQHYYDDEGIMSLVDYSTPRSSQDLSSPNAPRQTNGNQPSDTVIVPSSPVHQTTRVIEEEVFITERLGPVIIKSGEQIDMLSLTGEAGDIISIEVVTDNPYAGVYLEMDDYKNREVVGITAAELIMRNKLAPHPREFYASDKREDGTFVVKYSPESPDPYTDRIKIQVRNDVRGTNHMYARVPGQRLKMRAGLPVPLTLGFGAGSYVSDPQLAAVTLAETNTLLAKLGPNAYSSPIRNLEVAHDPKIPVGAYHPYMGIASEVTFHPEGQLGTNKRVVIGKIGEKLLSETGFPAPNTVAWPGKMVDGTLVPSEQQIIIYASKAEDSSAAMPSPIQEIEQNLYLKVGDTIYFPGNINESSVYYYDAGTSQWQRHNSESHLHDVTQGDGAYVFTCSPGVPVKVPKIDVPLSDTNVEGINVDSWGFTLPAPGFSNERSATERMLIHEVVVRRKRKKTLLL